MKFTASQHYLHDSVRYQIGGLICRSRFCTNRFQDGDDGVQIGGRECRGGQLLRCKQPAGEDPDAVQHAPLHDEVSTFGQIKLLLVELHARSTSKNVQHSRAVIEKQIYYILLSIPPNPAAAKRIKYLFRVV